MNPMQQAVSLGQGIWHDNIRRGLITSGELQHLISLGLTGLTSNPTIFEKAVAGGSDYDALLRTQARAGKNALETYEVLAVADIQAACDLLRPVFDRTRGGDGYASIEVSAASPDDTNAMLEEARRLWRSVNRPNAMIKIPGTDAGLPAVRQLLGEGTNVNITLIFSLERHKQVIEAFLAGLEDLVRCGGDPSKVASVASFFLSRVDTAIDPQLEGKPELKDLLGQSALSNAKLAYQNFKEIILDSPRFAALAAKGARVQRPLWASTGTKNPAYSDLHYVEPLFGPDTVNTLPPDTISALLDHGHVENTIERDVDKARETLRRLAEAGIEMDKVTDKLLVDGIKAFQDSFEKLLENIADKQAQLTAPRDPWAAASLGSQRAEVEDALDRLDEKQTNKRIWQKDHTVWSQDPTEITDRLGWLTVTDQMCEQVPALLAFANEVKGDGIRDVVLLGMGGSSLGPEVLSRVFGSREGYPKLTVLDSTVPGWVRDVTESINPSNTLFLVSSKSGTTAEPLAFYRHFRRLVEDTVGPERAGSHFVAITDPGTPLERMGQDLGFRRVFLNPPPIGGRYSVLSYFGLVPAALMGVDLLRLLDRADQMREGCAPYVRSEENPGAWLGAAIGSSARRGRNKLTLVTSPGLESFGLWAEQLLAESTGKNGKGVIPIAGEPLGDPACYRRDRLFVYLRLQEGDGHLDEDVDVLKAAGQPVIRLDLKDTYDLGGEFFRWESATAVAGAMLEINPFDQPDVQTAKDQTDRLLAGYRQTGNLPDAEVAGDIPSLLAAAHQGDYLAIMAYLPQSPEVEALIGELRRRVLEHHRIATTFGYGPRYLHSTGQLYKGGPASGLFLQLVAQSDGDIDIPGEPLTFGVLSSAQALGDLQALKERGRRVAQVRLGADHLSGLRRLVESIV